MDIAALSMGLSQMKVSQEAGISVLKMAMDSAKGSNADLVSMLEVNMANMQTMEQSVTPHIGTTIDITL